MDVPSLLDVLGKLATGGAVAVVVAFLLEQFTFFQKWSSEAKKWSVLALMLGIPVAATALLQFVPVTFWAILEPYWKAVAIGFAAWLASQVAHNWDKNR